MKRTALRVGLFVCLSACGAPDGEDAAASRAPLATAKPTQPTNVDAAPVTFELPEDPYLGVLPVGAFADINALCNKQKELIAPRIAEAKSAFADRELEMDLAPACAESPDALKDTRVSLGGPYFDAKAITLETGYSTDTFLVVRTSDGWSAVRDALLSDSHDDPGCPSIEREGAIVEVSAEAKNLVILTSGGRGWYGSDDDRGELYLTHVRACHFDEWAPRCSATETIAAKLVRLDDDPEAMPTTDYLFSTTYRIDEGGAIELAERFDEAKQL